MSVAIESPIQRGSESSSATAAVGSVPGACELRTGPRLVRATTPYTRENIRYSWLLLAQTLLVVGGLHVGLFFAPVWMKPVLGAIVGLIYVRLFIFYHDFLHGAQLRRSRFAGIVMGGVGYLVLAVTSVWRESHDYHHRHNARVIGSAIGSYPVVTLKMWRRMSKDQRRAYLTLRHPLNIFFGYLTVFMIGMSVSPFRRSPKDHWQAPLAVVVHFAFLITWGLAFGWWMALCAVVIPSFVASALGSYLFYAQHNFPGVRYFERREWSFDAAALRSSSMFDMPRWLHWATGNIGFHHIHHLNHRIPFYRLPEAYAALPELQQPGRTSWRPSDIRACLELAVWDGDEGRMITYKELRERAPETFAR